MPRGCAAGGALGRGTAWDGHAVAPDADLATVGDTRDGVCNPPEEACAIIERAAAANVLGAKTVTRGDGTANAPDLHLTLELPVRYLAWDQPGDA